MRHIKKKNDVGEKKDRRDGEKKENMGDNGDVSLIG